MGVSGVPPFKRRAAKIECCRSLGLPHLNRKVHQALSISLLLFAFATAILLPDRRVAISSKVAARPSLLEIRIDQPQMAAWPETSRNVF